MTSVAAASVLWYVMVDMLIYWYVHWVGLVHVYRVVLLNLDLVGLLHVHWYQLLHGNGHLLLDLLGNQLVDGHWDGMWYVDVYGVGLRYWYFDNLWNWDSHRVRYWNSDLLHYWHVHGLGVFDGFRRNVVVLGLDAGLETAAVAASISAIAATVTAAAKVVAAADVAAPDIVATSKVAATITLTTF